MKKILNWVLAATLVCGLAVFTSCSSDNDDNPAQEQAKKNRKEFVEHTRATMKDLAENLNFGSWTAANTLNLYFNQYVLNNPEFNKSVLNAFMQKMQQSVKPVEGGSELAEMGYQMYGTVDFTDFNYRFTENADNTGFDVEEADDFEVILNGWNALTQQVESGIYKLTLKAGGSQSFKFVQASRQQEGLAFVIIMPSEFQFAMSDKQTGKWMDGFSGSFKNLITTPADTEFARFGRDNWGVSGSVTSNFPAVADLNEKADQTTLSFDMQCDYVNHKGNGGFSWEQNGRKMLEMSYKQNGDGTGGIRNLDLSQFTTSSSILELLGIIVNGRNIEEVKLTLLDDLTTTMSVSDMDKVLQLQQEMAAARRHYADEATIDQYTQQLNQLIKAEMTCKGVNQTIPMKLVTQKFGVDWWTMPAFNFADENGYVSLIDLLDPESVTYGINIIDHAAEPMQQSIIVVRQLLQYVQTLFGTYQQQQGEEVVSGSN